MELQFTSTSHQRDYIDALNAHANELQRTDSSQALALALQAYKLSKQGVFQGAPYLRGMIDALLILSNINDTQNQLLEASAQAYEAYTLCKSSDDARLCLAVFNRLAWSCFRLGDYSKALEYALQLLSLAEKVEDVEHQAHTYNLIGAIYGDFGDHDQSIANLEKCLPLFQQVGNHERERAVLGNFSIAYRLSRHYAPALEFGLRALHMSVAAADPQHQAIFLTLVAEVYCDQQQNDAALDYYLQALALSEQRHYVRNINRVCFGLGRVYFQQRKFVEALAQLQRALAMAEQGSFKILIYQAHEELSRIYEQQGDFRQALHHYQQFHQIRNMVLNQEQAIRMQHIRVNYAMEQAQREAENQQRIHEEEHRHFEQLSRMKDELIGTASHDLKSPLSSMMLGIDMLREHGRLDDRIGQTLLDRLDTSAERMRELISNLLDLAKLETGQELRMSEVALRPFLADAVETFQALAQQRQIMLTLELPEGDILISGDGLRLRQVVDNLLSNAIKYTPDGGRVVVLAEAHSEEVVVRVRDTGIGIPSQALPHLFERFYRVNDQAHAAVEGTGLGLAIVKSIVEQHGGRVWVESQPAAGSTFSFSLPGAAPYAAA
ncbi:MAG: tetratricopeptide repeat-containing sensor histidine kinase [Anaerolineae bacterium]